MAEITARIPNIDWDKGFERHWNGGDPVSTHFFNALSFSFPQGERLFIDVVRRASRHPDLQISDELRKDIKCFIMQEALHTKHHEYYNNILEEQGYKNIIYDLVEKMNDKANKHLSSLSQLAVVSAYEHYTAIMSDYLLSNPWLLEKSPKPMLLIWLWHAVEETEHKAVCYDLYVQAGGGFFRRIFYFAIVSVGFVASFYYLYFSMLKRDGWCKIKALPRTLFRLSKLLFGRKGLGWHLLLHSLKYFSPTFHPWDDDNKELREKWLNENNASLKIA